MNKNALLRFCWKIKQLSRSVLLKNIVWFLLSWPTASSYSVIFRAISQGNYSRSLIGLDLAHGAWSRGGFVSNGRYMKLFLICFCSQALAFISSCSPVQILHAEPGTINIVSRQHSLLLIDQTCNLCSKIARPYLLWLNCSCKETQEKQWILLHLISFLIEMRISISISFNSVKWPTAGQWGRGLWKRAYTPTSIFVVPGIELVQLKREWFPIASQRKGLEEHLWNVVQYLDVSTE